MSQLRHFFIDGGSVTTCNAIMVFMIGCPWEASIGILEKHLAGI